MRSTAVAFAFLALAACGLAAQAAEERGIYWRPPPGWVVGTNHVFCAVHRGAEGWSAWETAQEVRESDPSKWASVVRPFVTEGLCLISRGGESMRVVGDQDNAVTGRVALIVETPDRLFWFISPHAFGPPKGDT